jgi:hypothetical protein
VGGGRPAVTDDADVVFFGAHRVWSVGCGKASGSLAKGAEAKSLRESKAFVDWQDGCGWRGVCER